MISLKKLFQAFPAEVHKQHFESATYIQEQLKCKTQFHLLGGKRLVIAPNLIRFKLGHYRLLFQAQNNSYQPISLIHRKNLSVYLKRRGK